MENASSNPTEDACSNTTEDAYSNTTEDACSNTTEDACSNQNMEDSKTRLICTEGTDQEDVSTIEEAIKEMGFGLFQIFLTVFCGILYVANSMENLAATIIYPIVKCQWDLSNIEEAAIVSALHVGMIVGATVWGFISDQIGRKKTLAIVVLFMLVFGILSAVKISDDDRRLPGYPWLLFCRFGLGLFNSGAPQIVTYYVEFLPPKGRGVLIVMLAVWWTVGVVLCAALAILVLGIGMLSWHWFMGLVAFPLALTLVFFPFVPESVRFYLVKGKEQQARSVINLIAKINRRKPPSCHLIPVEFKEEPVRYEDEIVLYHVSSADVDSTADDASDTAMEDTEIQNEESHSAVSKTVIKQEDLSNVEIVLRNGRSGTPQSNLKIKLQGITKYVHPLCVKGMWKTSILLYCIWFSSAWTYYGSVVLTTDFINSDSTCGFSSNMSNFTDCEELDTGDYVKILWASAAELPGIIVTFIVVDIIGRKKTLIFEYVLVAGGFLLLFICVSKIVTTAFLFIIRAFAIGIFQMSFVCTAEVYPTTSRSLGLGICFVAARVGAIMSPVIAQVVFNASVRGTIGIYAGSCLLSIIPVLLLQTETKGQVLKDK